MDRTDILKSLVEELMQEEERARVENISAEDEGERCEERERRAKWPDGRIHWCQN